jgi:hypothetical protein
MLCNTTSGEEREDSNRAAKSGSASTRCHCLLRIPKQEDGIKDDPQPIITTESKSEGQKPAMSEKIVLINYEFTWLGLDCISDSSLCSIRLA